MVETVGQPDVGRVQLVLALRNSGDEYEATRHNAGDWFVTALAAAVSTEFSVRSRLLCEEGRSGDVRLARSCTYMNESGRAAAALAGFYRIAPANILIVHDEMDLPVGQVRLKFAGGIAGHNGLRDVRNSLGSAGFWRLRIGIGRPAEYVDPANYVLAAPATEQRRLINAGIIRAVEVWPAIAAGDMNAAMLDLHSRADVPE
ncbi:MAG: aminoacyl-tRNA hydrolase, partial [Betaproteobacteria bacterium]|nr:aminoacyl-tRNA hydrolase [Betaproteobacteria bacterium]